MNELRSQQTRFPFCAPRSNDECLPQEVQPFIMQSCMTQVPLNIQSPGSMRCPGVVQLNCTWQQLTIIISYFHHLHHFTVML